jgi:hypothetical protein
LSAILVRNYRSQKITIIDYSSIFSSNKTIKALEILTRKTSSKIIKGCHFRA